MTLPSRRLNLVGVAILTLLSGLQWRTNRIANLTILELEKTRQTQDSTITQQNQAIQGLTQDLSTLKEHVTETQTTLKETASRLRLADHTVAQRSEECRQLKSSITHWTAALAERDARLAETSQRLRVAAEEQAQLTGKYNELAEKHNGIIGELNSRTTHYNALVERFNDLAKTSKASSAR